MMLSRQLIRKRPAVPSDCLGLEPSHKIRVLDQITPLGYQPEPDRRVKAPQIEIVSDYQDNLDNSAVFAREVRGPDKQTLTYKDGRVPQRIQHRTAVKRKGDNTVNCQSPSKRLCSKSSHPASASSNKQTICRMSENFNNFQYWRPCLPNIEDELLNQLSDGAMAAEPSSEENPQFNTFNFWRTPIGDIDLPDIDMF